MAIILLHLFHSPLLCFLDARIAYPDPSRVAARSSLIRERAAESLDCTIKIDEGNSTLNRAATGKPVAAGYPDR